MIRARGVCRGAHREQGAHRRPDADVVTGSGFDELPKVRHTETLARPPPIAPAPSPCSPRAHLLIPRPSQSHLPLTHPHFATAVVFVDRCASCIGRSPRERSTSCSSRSSIRTTRHRRPRGARARHPSAAEGDRAQAEAQLTKSQKDAGRRRPTGTAGVHRRRAPSRPAQRCQHCRAEGRTAARAAADTTEKLAATQVPATPPETHVPPPLANLARPCASRSPLTAVFTPPAPLTMRRRGAGGQGERPRKSARGGQSQTPSGVP